MKQRWVDDNAEESSRLSQEAFELEMRGKNLDTRIWALSRERDEVYARYQAAFEAWQASLKGHWEDTERDASQDCQEPPGRAKAWL